MYYNSELWVCEYMYNMVHVQVSVISVMAIVNVTESVCVGFVEVMFVGWIVFCKM